MTLKGIEDEVEKLAESIRRDIIMYESYMKIGFITQARTVKERMHQKHEKVMRLKDQYKKLLGRVRC